MARLPASSTITVLSAAFLLGMLGACAQSIPAGPDQSTVARSYETRGVPMEVTGAHSRITDGMQVDVTGLGFSFLR